MVLKLDALVSLLLACAPMVAPETGVKLVRHESSGNPWAIGINGPFVLKPQPVSREQAIATAKWLLRTPGVKSIDMGLGMINSETMKRLGLSVEETFEPCTNLAAMQAVLHPSYLRWAQKLGPGDAALQRALSEYNTGSPQRGLDNGYVRKVYLQPIS